MLHRVIRSMRVRRLFYSDLDFLGEPKRLTSAERTDLVRHRCLTRPLQDPDASPSPVPGGRLTPPRT